MGFVRTECVLVHDMHKASYRKGRHGGGTEGPREHLLQMNDLAYGKAPPDVVESIYLVDQAILERGGDPRHTDLLRPVESSAAARAKYERWLADGEPESRAEGFDKEIHKNAFVAKAGFSTHGGGRGNDRQVMRKLKSGKFEPVIFPNDPLDQQLDILWPILLRFGWRPIIKAPVEITNGRQTKEAWHSDFWGEFEGVRKRLGYKMAAMCTNLDVGVDCYSRWEWKFVQAQLQRGGYDVGEVDGWAGRKKDEGSRKMGMTRRALGELGLDHLTDDPTQLFLQVSAVPSSLAAIWRPS